MGSALRFHFDLVSPYAYLAWTQIHTLAARHGRIVDPVPVLFAGLLEAHGTKGPAEVAAKRAYMAKDTMRIARALDVPFAPPPSHPFNPLLALRIASLPLPQDTRKTIIDRLYAAAWANGPGVTDPQTVAKLVTECGLDGAQTIADATTPEGKERVRTQTNRAIEDGVFGVPTTILDGELFWGVDSLPHLDRYLSGQGTFDPKTIERWEKLRPSAERQKR